MNAKTKLKLYFFDPKLDEEKYHSDFKSLVNEEIVAYSPLYTLRRQILFMSGIIPGIGEEIFHKTYLSAIIVSNIAVTGLAQLIYDKEKVSSKEYKDFYQKYFGKDPIQMLGLRVLRNGLEHNNFQLYSRLYKNNKFGTKNYFDDLIEYLSHQPDWSGIWRPEKELIEFLKVTFAMSANENWEIISTPSIQGYDKTKKYLLIQYRINPFLYIKRLESGIDAIRKVIISNKLLLEQFDRAITMDSWMKVYAE